jgi:hypothetical protein
MGKSKPLQVPAKSGPLARLSRAQLRMLDNGQASVDSMNEAESGGRHASDATLNAGQAAADAFKALWGKR